MNKLAGSALLAAIVAGSGCSTINPYTGEKQTAKATSGAAIGAAVGALIGIATSDNAKERKERALKGAGIGAIAGGGVGDYMDVVSKVILPGMFRMMLSPSRVTDTPDDSSFWRSLAS